MLRCKKENINFHPEANLTYSKILGIRCKVATLLLLLFPNSSPIHEFFRTNDHIFSPVYTLVLFEKWSLLEKNTNPYCIKKK